MFIGAEKESARRMHRHWLAIAAGGLLAVQALPAAAFKFDLGSGFSGAFDSTVSYGVDMRMQKPSCTLIGQDNGGCASLSAQLPEASADAYFLNADDGDQNYKYHDFFSENIKGTHELQIKAPDDFSFFGRISEVYDWRIGDTERTPLAPTARPWSTYNIMPLDLYINKNFEWLGNSARLRIGNQVISWGEDIFVLGGINSTNAYDIRRYHVAGAQVKEILRPAPMISINTDLIPQVSMEAYWQWHWNGFVLDPTGTYFSSADPVGKGNDNAIFIPTSSVNAEIAANSEAQALLAAGLIRLMPAGTLGDPGGTGLTTAQMMSTTYMGPRIRAGLTTSNPLSPAAVAALIAATPQLQTGTAIPLVSNAGGSSNHQYGVNFRYRPDWTDISFGFYYERFTSKIPFISYIVSPAYAAYNPVSAAYRIDYPSDIQLYGVSYNTNAAGWAFGGEVSWRPQDPVAIDPSVPSGNIANSAPYACVNDGGGAAGKYCNGWVNKAKIQVQQSALQIFDPSEGLGGLVLRGLNAKEGYFLGEVGLVDYPHLNRLGGIPWSLPNYALPDKFSAGYTLESQITYPNVMNLGFDWLPQIDWSHGVVGNTPNTLPWQARAKAATFTLNFNRHNVITAAFAYNWFFGGGPANQTSDRDYMSFTLAYNF
jgi:hypothetical protein